MGKLLIIKGADFATNAIDTVISGSKVTILYELKNRTFTGTDYINTNIALFGTSVPQWTLFADGEQTDNTDTFIMSCYGNRPDDTNNKNIPGFFIGKSISPTGILFDFGSNGDYGAPLNLSTGKCAMKRTIDGSVYYTTNGVTWTKLPDSGNINMNVLTNRRELTFGGRSDGVQLGTGIVRHAVLYDKALDDISSLFG